jgi:hypothetical protein
MEADADTDTDTDADTTASEDDAPTMEASGPNDVDEEAAAARQVAATDDVTVAIEAMGSGLPLCRITVPHDMPMYKVFSVVAAKLCMNKAEMRLLAPLADNSVRELHPDLHQRAAVLRLFPAVFFVVRVLPPWDFDAFLSKNPLPIIVIVGPHSSGRTAMAQHLVRRLKAARSIPLVLHVSPKYRGCAADQRDMDAWHTVGAVSVMFARSWLTAQGGPAFVKAWNPSTRRHVATILITDNLTGITSGTRRRVSAIMAFQPARQPPNFQKVLFSRTFGPMPTTRKAARRQVALFNRVCSRVPTGLRYLVCTMVPGPTDKRVVQNVFHYGASDSKGLDPDKGAD